MASKPLGYESLKTVLEYMDANLRFQLSKRIPSIQNVERVVPLKINELVINSSGICINNTEYQLGIYKNYPSLEVIPEYVQKWNNTGGLRHDIDHLGFIDYSDDGVLTPGDGILRNQMNEQGDEIGINQERNKRNLAKFIEEKEYRIERLESTMEEKIAELGENSSLANPNMSFEEYVNAYTFPYRDSINNVRQELEPYYHLRDNTNPKYETWIQLTMKSESTGDIIEIERVKYNRKLNEALKYLWNTLFGRRKTSVRVKEFTHRSLSPVIQFPIDLKLRIRELNVHHIKMLKNEEFMFLIDDSSYPLQQLYIHFVAGELNSKITESAQKLKINHSDTPRTLLRFLLNSSRKTVICSYSSLTSEQHFLVIQKCLKSNLEVGMEHSFATTETGVAHHLLKIIAGRIDGAVMGIRSVTIPMNNEAQLKVSYSPDKTSSNSSLRMEVVKTIRTAADCLLKQLHEYCNLNRLH